MQGSFVKLGEIRSALAARVQGRSVRLGRIQLPRQVQGRSTGGLDDPSCPPRYRVGRVELVKFCPPAGVG